MEPLDPPGPSMWRNVKASSAKGTSTGIPIVRAPGQLRGSMGRSGVRGPRQSSAYRPCPAPLAAELEFRLPGGVRFSPLPDGDLYAPKLGSLDGIPPAIPTQACAVIHGYGMLRRRPGRRVDSGGERALTVNGQAPRHLDRNVTLFGQVVQGMELLSGPAAGPRRWDSTQRRPSAFRSDISRVAADLPEPERPTAGKILRTDTETFQRWLEARRNQRRAFGFTRPGAGPDISNLPIPVRTPSP